MDECGILEHSRRRCRMHRKRLQPETDDPLPTIALLERSLPSCINHSPNWDTSYLPQGDPCEKDQPDQ
jgi:hypothetical protein